MINTYIEKMSLRAASVIQPHESAFVCIPAEELSDSSELPKLDSTGIHAPAKWEDQRITEWIGTVPIRNVRNSHGS